MRRAALSDGIESVLGNGMVFGLCRFWVTERVIEKVTEKVTDK